MVSPVEADWCLLFSLWGVGSPNFHWMQKKKRNDQKEVIINHICNLICNSFFFWLGAHIVSISTLLICWSFRWFLFHSMCGYSYPCISIVVFFCFLSLNWPACKMTLKKKKKNRMLLWSCKERSAILLFTQFKRIWDKKKQRNCCAPWVPPEPSERWINDAQKMGASRRRLPSAGCFCHFEHFPWHLFWMTAEARRGGGKCERKLKPY